MVCEVGFTQIAGLVARRILPFVRDGDDVDAGQRIGLIRFGSRVDVYLPAGTSPRVLLGQRSHRRRDGARPRSASMRPLTGISQ